KPDAPSGAYWIETGFYEPVTGQRLAQYQNDAPAGSATLIGPLKVHGQAPIVASNAPPLATFGDGILQLLAIDRQPGQVLLRWQALRTPPTDYTVFVHVLDAQGRLIAQNDSPPQDGTYPMSLWDAGEIVDDRHAINLSGGAKLEIGLYAQPDLQRLPALDTATGAQSDSIIVPAQP
ncbi:MAG TPA: hypothetical protein VKU60_12775, partial [Chloroflexota bacterium]|nr:hypothetical protein [Chloroflexota bacterium]